MNRKFTNFVTILISLSIGFGGGYWYWNQRAKEIGLLTHYQSAQTHHRYYQMILTALAEGDHPRARSAILGAMTGIETIYVEIYKRYPTQPGVEALNVQIREAIAGLKAKED